MPDQEVPWRLERFIERLDLWIALETPDDTLRLAVTEQILTRMETPYRGVKRVSAGDNLWFGVIPGTAHPSGRVVTWCYRIFESRRTVRCDLIESLGVPI